MLVFLYRRPDRYPAFAMQLQAMFSAREQAYGLMQVPATIAPEIWTRLAGVRGAFEPLARASSAQDLIDAVAELGLVSEPFVIEHTRLSHAPDRSRMHSKALCGRLAMVISGDVSFRAPRVRYHFFESEGGYSFTRRVYDAPQPVRSWSERPITLSSALPPELAAAAINAVASPGDRLVDPMCGSGTVLYEASVRGIEARGFDINWDWVRGARENLGSLGVEHDIRRADARAVDFEADAVVANLPYGRRTETTPEVIRDILANLLGRAKRYAFFSGRSIADVKRELGYDPVLEVDISNGPREGRFLTLAGALES